MQTDSAAPISKLEDNHYIERNYDDNITVVRKAKPSDTLEKDQYFARLIESTSIAEGIKLEKLASRVMIAKAFPHVARLMGNSVVIVRIKDNSKCCIF
jgi:hypothetical protein